MPSSEPSRRAPPVALRFPPPPPPPPPLPPPVAAGRLREALPLALPERLESV